MDRDYVYDGTRLAVTVLQVLFFPTPPFRGEQVLCILDAAKRRHEAMDAAEINHGDELQ